MDKTRIVARLREQHSESVATCSALSTADFIAPRGTSWSYADHIRHLTKTIRAINRGLTLSWWKLWLAFGRAKQPSRTYEQVRDTYLAALTTFNRPNPFAPSARDPREDPEAWRAQTMRYYDIAFEDLIRITETLDERSLDKYRLPHPLIGKLTLREMLYFTIYHNLHHIKRLTPDG